MGLFDSVAGSVLSSVMGGGSSGGGDLASAVLGMVQGQEGGLGGLVGKLASAGLADQVSSWVGTGENLPVNPDQIASALGDTQIGELAAKLGLSNEQISSGLATILPMVIDKMTPNGQVEAGGGDLMSQGLSMLGGLLNKG